MRQVSQSSHTLYTCLTITCGFKFYFNFQWVVNFELLAGLEITGDRYCGGENSQIILSLLMDENNLKNVSSTVMIASYFEPCTGFKYNLFVAEILSENADSSNLGHFWRKDHHVDQWKSTFQLHFAAHRWYEKIYLVDFDENLHFDYHSHFILHGALYDFIIIFTKTVNSSHNLGYLITDDSFTAAGTLKLWRPTRKTNIWQQWPIPLIFLHRRLRCKIYDTNRHDIGRF